MNINFFTTNKGKAASLRKHFAEFGLTGHNIVLHTQELIEPQANTVEEVSLIKAQQAYDIIKAPVLVNDSGFCIQEFNGVPGPYTKYFLETMGIEGILKLMKGVKNRNCKYVNTASYIDENGKLFQFSQNSKDVILSETIRGGEHPESWSDLWKITIDPLTGKTLAEMNETERTIYSKNSSQSGLYLFAEWISKQK